MACQGKWLEVSAHVCNAPHLSLLGAGRWALGAGELPEWVARTLDHVDTSMVYRTYGRYVPT